MIGEGDLIGVENGGFVREGAQAGILDGLSLGVEECFEVGLFAGGPVQDVTADTDGVFFCVAVSGVGGNRAGKGQGQDIQKFYSVEQGVEGGKAFTLPTVGIVFDAGQAHGKEALIAVGGDQEGLSFEGGFGDIAGQIDGGGRESVDGDAVGGTDDKLGRAALLFQAGQNALDVGQFLSRNTSRQTVEGKDGGGVAGRAHHDDMFTHLHLKRGYGLKGKAAVFHDLAGAHSIGGRSGGGGIGERAGRQEQQAQGE